MEAREGQSPAVLVAGGEVAHAYMQFALGISGREVSRRPEVAPCKEAVWRVQDRRNCPQKRGLEHVPP